MKVQGLEGVVATSDGASWRLCSCRAAAADEDSGAAPPSSAVQQPPLPVLAEPCRNNKHACMRVSSKPCSCLALVLHTSLCHNRAALCEMRCWEVRAGWPNATCCCPCVPRS
jgi:hypothetical protein